MAVNSPLGLGLAALAGSLDPTHQVRIHAGEKGFELTLHHGLSCAMHRHGAMARMLTAFAQPAAAANPDHVLQFRANDTFSREVQIGFPRASLSEQPLLAFVPQSFEWSRADLTLAGPPQLPSPGQAMARSLPPTILLL